MKRITLPLFAALLAAPLPATATDNGFYVGGSLGRSSIEQVADLGPGFGEIDFSDRDTAYKLFAGFRIMSYIGVEAGYLDLGSPSDTVGEITELDVKIGVSGWDAFGVGFLPIGPIDLFVKLGLISWEADFLAAWEDTTGSSSDSGTDAAWGLGIAVRLGSVAVRAEGERFEIEDVDEVYLFSVGATFTF